MMNLSNVIKTIEELKAKYWELKSNTTDEAKLEKFAGITSALSAILGDLIDMELYHERQFISKDELILMILDYREEYACYLEDEMDFNNGKKEKKYKGAIAAFGQLLNIFG